MDWIYRAVLTAALVALVLLAGRTFGQRFAGALAGLPTVTGPALIWLALDFGAGYAADAASASIAACGLCALFAVVYAWTSRHAGAAIAVLFACGASAVVAMPLEWLDANLPAALALAAAASAAAYRAIPDAGRDPRRALPLRNELWLTAAVSGLISAAVGIAAPQLGAFWAGVLASPPLIAAIVAAHQQMFCGHHAASRFLRGYVAGLLGRAVFGAGFCLSIAPLGLSAAALIGAVAGCAVTAAALRVARPSGEPAGREAVPLR